MIVLLQQQYWRYSFDYVFNCRFLTHWQLSDTITYMVHGCLIFNTCTHLLVIATQSFYEWNEQKWTWLTDSCPAESANAGMRTWRHGWNDPITIRLLTSLLDFRVADSPLRVCVHSEATPSLRSLVSLCAGNVTSGAASLVSFILLFVLLAASLR